MRKMLLCLLLVSSTAFATDRWVELIDNQKGTVWFSPESISTDGFDRKMLWLKFSEKKKSRKYDYEKMLKVIDCEKRQVGVAAAKSYKNGKLVQENAVPYLMAKMQTPDPDEFDMFLIRSLCIE